MASLTTGDLASKFNSSPFLDIVSGEFLKTLNLFGSGFLAEAPDDVVNTGTFGNMPHWNVDLTAATEISDSSDLTPGESTAYNDSFIWQELEYSWSIQELINTVAGKSYDGIGEVAKHIGNYWAYQLQSRALSVLTGVFSTALASTHSTGVTYAGATVSAPAILAGKFKLGDFANQLSLIVMNSKVYMDAVNNNIVTFPAGSVGNSTFATGNTGNILGLTPYMDDDLSATSSVYPSYIGGARSMVFKLRPRQKAVMNNANFARTANNIDIELSRNTALAGGTDIITTRISGMVHVPGVAWDTTDSSFTAANLATGSNWTKVGADKEIKVAQIKTL
jgi:hypothetical protein